MKLLSYHNSIFLVLVFFYACGVRKHLPAGEQLYGGAKVKSEKADGVQQSSSSINKSLKGIAYPDRNKMLFGAPYRVWWWYVIGPTKKEKGLKYWLRNKIGEPPVFFSSVNEALTAESMEAYLENEGYFNSKVGSDTALKGYKCYALYKARVERPYLFDTIQWRLDSSQVSQELVLLPAKDQTLKKGDRYRVDAIKAETERISQLLKAKGYYYFKAGHLLTYVDTNHNKYTASIYLTVDEEAPGYTMLSYRLGKIVAVVPGGRNFSLTDSIIQTLPVHDSIQVSDPPGQFRPRLFPAAIVFRPGQQYTPAQQNKSLTRLNSYGVFKFIKTEFRRDEDDGGNRLLNAYYYTTPYTKKTFQFEVGGFTKSNNYWGGEVSFSWKNRNLFKGAEILSIRPKGSFEVSFNDSLKNNNIWRVGVEAELSLPKFLAPGFVHRTFGYIPKTNFIISYDRLKRQELYTEYYLHFRYELNWSNKPSRDHKLIPVSLTHRNSADLTEEFISRGLIDTALKYTLPSSLVPATAYRYVFSNTSFRKRKFYYLQASLETSGFFIGLIKGNDGFFTTKIGKAQLMQYLRGEFETRYSHQLGKNLYWFNRGIVGISYPYGNSPFMPFFRQFIIGGANSLRGFLPKQIGPGSAKATALQINGYPQVGGDYKLELNSELRIPLTGSLKAGFFVDAGNIWMKDTLLYSVKGKISNDFWKEIAIDGGFGLRLDVSILVLRLDLGVPFYKPWLPEGARWTFKDFDVGSSDWRKENLVLNLAIGYPF